MISTTLFYCTLCFICGFILGACAALPHSIPGGKIIYYRGYQGGVEYDAERRSAPAPPTAGSNVTKGDMYK